MILEPPPQQDEFNWIWRKWFYNFWDRSTNKGIDNAANETVIQLDDDATAGNTRLLLYDVDNGTLERVSVGVADSGGAGYKVLRIPN